MKLSILLPGLWAASVVLAGCAGGPAVAPADDMLDRDRMAAVERAAAGAGVRVLWVNPPRKPPARSGG